jgi:[acyl-carrier-protein] S-malonyltransferase
MASANRESEGAMAAVLGLGPQTVQQLCATAQARCGEPVEVANDNDPGQLVVSGTVAAVGTVTGLAKAAGAARVVPLEVSAAFHSSLMRPVEDAFAVALDGIRFRDPSVPVLANVTADHVRTAAQARECLRRQLVGTVQWTQTLRRLGQQVGQFVEVGPGRVLTGFCRTTLPDVPVHATGDSRRLRQTLRVLGRSDEDASGFGSDDRSGRRVA